MAYGDGATASVEDPALAQGIDHQVDLALDRQPWWCAGAGRGPRAARRPIDAGEIRELPARALA